jgi:hypothetical protein
MSRAPLLILSQSGLRWSCKWCVGGRRAVVASSPRIAVGNRSKFSTVVASLLLRLFVCCELVVVVVIQCVTMDTGAVGEFLQ